MKNKGKTIAEIRSTVPKQGKENGNPSVRTAGPPELRNKTKYPDSLIQRQVDLAEDSIVNEFPERDISFDQNEEAKQALRFFSFIRASFIENPERGPQSVSHARRYQYDDEQLKYWRDEMIRALGEI